MKTYQKDKKIEIWRDFTDTDEDGFSNGTEKKIHSGKLWAYYRQASAKETFYSMSIQQQIDAIFIISHRDDINPKTDYILFRGKKYYITTVDDYEGGKHDITITARFRQ